MLDGLATWWGAVELWLAQQWFPVQFALVILVVAPLCLGLTMLGEGVGDVLVAWWHRRGKRTTAGRSS